MTKRDEYISLAQGNGGRLMRELITRYFQAPLMHPLMDVLNDAAEMPVKAGVKWKMTSDSFTVKPLEFPGGSIGSLAIHGVVNDLAVCGATPKYLSLNVILEEGLSCKVLERVMQDMSVAARKCNVAIITGDTKVVPRGEGSGIYFSLTGVGEVPQNVLLGMQYIQQGDILIINGSIGDHATAVMLAREEYGLSGNLKSDSSSVCEFTEGIRELPGVRFMRDPTRGGLATVCHEISRSNNCGVVLSESSIPIKPPVKSLCEILGFDPLFMACEGRVVAVVAEDIASEVLMRWQQVEGGENAAIIGEITKTNRVELKTLLGGRRVIQELEDDPLPRIC